METITINEIDVKPSGLVIVKYNAHLNVKALEATMNTKWQGQEVDYMLKDVGVGGSVSVLIQQKGEYTNITKVDMTSGVKSTPTHTYVDVTSAVKGNNLTISKELAEKTRIQEQAPNPQRVGLYIKLAVEMECANPHEGMAMDVALCENVQEIKKLEDFVIKLLMQDER